MFTFRLKCPHCLNIESFVVQSVNEYRGMAPIGIVNGQGHGIARKPTSAPEAHQQTGVACKTYGTATCPRPACGGPVLIWFALPRGMQLVRQGGGNTPLFGYSGPQPEIIATWPSPPSPDDSEHWPDGLREVFKEVQEDAKAQRNVARIVSTCRSVLEVALAALGYAKAAGTLQTRINKAVADGLITKGMAEWAAKIKIDGNEAIHELTASRKDADDLVAFIRTFLEVAFDLPEKIKVREAHPTLPE